MAGCACGMMRAGVLLAIALESSGHLPVRSDAADCASCGAAPESQVLPSETSARAEGVCEADQHGCSRYKRSADVGAGAAGDQFWQITDIHWDRNYTESGDSSNWCHGSGEAVAAHNGLYGNYSCDAPWQLVKEAVKEMSAIQPKPSFIIWTGDNAPHWDQDPDFKYIFTAIDSITRLMEQAFPGVPIIPCLGNHDTFPANQMPGENKLFYDRFLSEGGWARLLSPEQQRSFTQAGYHAHRISDKLTVLALNTNMYYLPNKAVSPKEEDPGQQLDWLRDQLKNARTDQYKVIIGAHIAPGYFERSAVTPFMYEAYNDALLTLLADYSDVILAQVYGHGHTDSFRVLGRLQDDKLKLESAIFLAPSVTPWVPGAGTNPGVRLYSYTPSVLSDYSQYVLNLSASNAAGSAEWRHLYSAAETYSLSDLSVESMAGLFDRLLSDPQLFDTYYRLNTGGHDVQPCDLACKRSQLCAISHLTEKSMATCLNSVATADAILSGETLVHGPSDPETVVCELPEEGTSHYYAIVFGVLAGLALLSVLIGLFIFRLRKRPQSAPTVLRNVASFVSVGSQGYETMT